ncbi:hypothetical protein [Streptomyces sp. NPDC012888]|uniref:hypothetical protein n=1 Tax=Streptomyces sp. NPDC012888 TaxID=3364855 RepID=UPI00367C27BD
MTRLRTSHRLRRRPRPHHLTTAALACALLLSPASTAAAASAALATPAATFDDPRELAGSPAGAGRERPGRPVGAPANPEVYVASRPLPHGLSDPRDLRDLRDLRGPHDPPGGHSRPDAERPPAAERERPAAPTAPTEAGQPPRSTAIGPIPNARAADLAAHILPLGTGLALMGVGLGFIGVRLRRG